MKFGEQKPGIVHRLDKETSGILVVAKNDKAHEDLTQQFKKRSVHRIYYAVCMGVAKPPKGQSQSYLARHPVDRKRYASILSPDKKVQTTKEPTPTSGKWAVTHYEVLKSHSGLSYCRLKLETGRTHQIRVHLAEKGTPVAGDSLYGADKKIKAVAAKKAQVDLKNLNRFLLHAAELGFVHPITRNELFFSVDWPTDIKTFLQQWGLK
jgi:23S rRNA pseudouridine1911/1915/1917 synthase